MGHSRRKKKVRTSKKEEEGEERRRKNNIIVRDFRMVGRALEENVQSVLKERIGANCRFKGTTKISGGLQISLESSQVKKAIMQRKRDLKVTKIIIEDDVIPREQEIQVWI